MTIDTAALMGTYASYHEVFGNYYDKERLIEEIRIADVQNLLLTIAMLNNPSSINSDEIREDFTSYMATQHPSHPIRQIFSQYAVLFHPQGLLNTSKWLIAYGDFDKNEPIFSHVTMFLYVRQAIKYCMIISDYLDQRMEGANRLELIQADLLRNANFNSSTDIAALTARTLYLLNDLSNISEDAGFDYKTDFFSKFNYTILEYVSLLFALYSIYLTNNQNISVFNIDTFFNNTKIPERARYFFNLLMCHPADIKDTVISTIENSWDFRAFWSKPLLALPCGRVHPLLPSILVSNLYIDLEIKICQLYPQNKRSEIKACLGLQFEKYVCELAYESFERAKHVTKIIPEFTYGQNKSPDFMVLQNDTLIAIEVKSLRPLADFAFQDDLEPVQNGVKKLIIDPFNQVLSRLGELMDKDLWDGYSRPKISAVHIIVVTIKGITSWKPNEIYIHESLDIPNNVPLAGHFHVDVEEFELLCELITRKKAKPLAHYLNRNNPQCISFNHFLRQEKLHPQRPKRIKRLYEVKTYQIRKTIFK